VKKSRRLLITSFGAGAEVAVLYEPGDVFSHVNPEIASGKDLVGFGSSGMADSGQGVVLLNELGSE
jgi:hypothetical protein